MEKELPEGWVEIGFKEVISYKKGKKPRILKNEEFGDSVPYLDIRALEHGDFRQYADIECSNLVADDSVAIVWDGARSGWVAKVKYGAIGSTIAALSPILVDVDYTYYYLRSQFRYLNTNTRGTGIPHVDPEVLWSLNFPLPPLAEQKRIVAKLDEGFQHLDTLKAKLERIPELLKNFRRAILTQAVTGKLTEEWREDKEGLQTGEQVYQDVLHDLEIDFQSRLKRAKEEGRSKPKDHRKNKKSDKQPISLLDLPEEWCYVRAEDISYLITDGAHFKPTYIEEGVKFLSVKNVRPFRISAEDCKYISVQEHTNLIKRCNPEPNDLLYTKVGATYGYAAKIQEAYEFSIFVSLALIKPSKILDSRFLEILFNSELVFEQARQRVSGSGVPDLHLIEIRDFRLPLMSIEEQKEIVKRVEALFAKADAIEGYYATIKEKIDKLPQALLAKAFRGELVPQDPNDEPASVLLGKIRIAKAGAVKLGKGKKAKGGKQGKLVL
ncbi:restriction endonuclease subunit S [Botryobacter ruber]|uniref:restriction endonuclease subunit S n=1 Tax=Botryobacter ruber TaxID=2171629 RepID=UPI000E0B0D21|nr:restriction endonuclease subunit S [Botryobacter ruber]